MIPRLLRDLQGGRNVVLTAEPGAGKTTRVPPALLGQVGGEILVLQPRRLAARMAATRVAAELGESVGHTCGYRVRFDSKAGPDTRVQFVTEGILTRRLREDPQLRGVSVVIFDEFHERHLDSDLGLALTRQARRGRDDLAIVVMSATLDPGPVTDYLDATHHACPGRTHPIHIDHDASASDRPLGAQVSRALRRLLDDGLEGDVLVFLPGVREIREATDACDGLARSADMDVVQLYGELPATEQDRAVAPGPRRKVILSTNVAETSVTVEGVVAVIDSGLARVAAHDPWAGLPVLELRKISRASAIQRAGRAGRLRPGRCLRLYTEADFNRRAAHDIPEVARLDLTTARLDLAACGVTDAGTFPWLEAPPAAALQAADELLRRLGALDPAGALTETGRELSRLPVHPRFGRILVEARRLGIPNLACRAVSLWSERDVRRDRRRPRSHGTGADVLADLRDVDDKHPGLNPGAVRHAARVAKQLQRSLGGTRDAAADPEDALAMAALAGFPDRVARVQEGGRLAMCGGGKAELDPTSVGGGAELVVAIGAEQRRDRGRDRVVVHNVVAVDAATILETREDEVHEHVDVRLDPEAGRVVAASELRYGELVLDRTALRELPEEARAVFRQAVLAADRSRLLDVDALIRLRARVGFLVAHGLATGGIDEDTINHVLGSLADTHTSFAAIRRSDPVSQLRATLPPELNGSLDRLAPSVVKLPGGRKLTVHYELDRPPWVESRLQDFFGSLDGPSVGDGRVPLVLHLLAPNQRAVQVTTDLAGFWDRHYPDLRKQLMRRYPKHDWPDDPRTATPPAPSGPRRRRK